MRCCAKLPRKGEAVLSGLDRERLSTPDWLWTRWMAQYGAGTARLIARAHQQAAPVDVVLKSPHAAVPESDDLFGNVRRLKAEGRIEDLPGFAEGDWWVQDAAATLPALLLGDVTGKKVIDLCAAPGGKTLQLAARGAKVTAVEIDATRADRIRENLARTKLDAEIVQSDARDFDGKAPLVLIDAPCTATGTIRRHPDLPWIKGAADVTVSAAVALRNSGKRRVHGGARRHFGLRRLFLEREEGENRSHLSSRPIRIRPCAVTANEVFAHSDWITPDGDLRTLPCHVRRQGWHDGFYAARLKAIRGALKHRHSQDTPCRIRRQHGRCQQPPPSPSRARVSIFRIPQIGVGGRDGIFCRRDRVW
jgi:16S rRNA (cytosine967-C5)-methyltransferase